MKRPTYDEKNNQSKQQKVFKLNINDGLPETVDDIIEYLCKYSSEYENARLDKKIKSIVVTIEYLESFAIARDRPVIQQALHEEKEDFIEESNNIYNRNKGINIKFLLAQGFKQALEILASNDVNQKDELELKLNKQTVELKSEMINILKKQIEANINNESNSQLKLIVKQAQLAVLEKQVTAIKKEKLCYTFKNPYYKQLRWILKEIRKTSGEKWVFEEILDAPTVYFQSIYIYILFVNELQNFIDILLNLDESEKQREDYEERRKAYKNPSNSKLFKELIKTLSDDNDKIVFIESVTSNNYKNLIDFAILCLDAIKINKAGLKEHYHQKLQNLKLRIDTSQRKKAPNLDSDKDIEEAIIEDDPFENHNISYSNPLDSSLFNQFDKQKKINSQSDSNLICEKTENFVHGNILKKIAPNDDDGKSTNLNTKITARDSGIKRKRRLKENETNKNRKISSKDKDAAEILNSIKGNSAINSGKQNNHNKPHRSLGYYNIFEAANKNKEESNQRENNENNDNGNNNCDRNHFRF